MDFFLFVVLNAVLFIRPADFVPALISLPIFNAVALVCLAVSFGPVIKQLSIPALAPRSISVCVMGLLLAIILSHLSHFAIEDALRSALEFSKVLVYYFLLVATLNSPRRLSGFLSCLCAFIVVMSGLALMEYYGVVDLPAFAPMMERVVDSKTGEVQIVARLCGSGIFNNPNDISRMSIVGMVICLYKMNDRSSGVLRPLWLAPLWLLGDALIRTYSRGAFLGLLAGVLAFLCARFGRKAIIPIALALPLLFVLFAGRTTDLTTSEGTGQQRIKLWGEAYILLRQSPLFGIGMEKFVEEAGLVAHNSFVQCYTELGLFGGTLFFGAHLCALLGIYQVHRRRRWIADGELARLGPYLLAIIASYSMGMFTSTRSYEIPTFMPLGVVTAYIALAESYLPSPILPFNRRMCRLLVINGIIICILIYIFVRLNNA
jgi:hypothetical protein